MIYFHLFFKVNVTNEINYAEHFKKWILELLDSNISLKLYLLKTLKTKYL